MKKERATTGVLLLLLFGMGIGAATAQVVTGDYGTPPKLVPYTGYLEDNGIPVSGSVDLSFFVVASPADPSSSALWQEDHTGVVASGGKFAVTLGQSTGFGTLFADYGELFVGVSIDGTDLDGRQRLVSAPYGISAGEARNFTVRGTLDVTGQSTLNGGLAVTGDVSVSGDHTQEVRAGAGVRLRKNGNISRVSFDAQSNDPGEIVHYESDNTGELWLSSSDDWDANASNDRIIFGEYASRTEAFSVRGDGLATVRGDLVVQGNAWNSNDWSDEVLKSPSNGNTVTGTATPNGGWAIRQCGNGQYMCGLAFSHPSGQNNTHQERFTIRCCSL
jgi:hypothetical protein